VKKKGCLIGFGTALVAVLLLLFATSFGKGLRDILKSGLLYEAKQEKFTANVDEQLKMMHAAAMTHHQSEEKFPEGVVWMDDVLKRMQTQDLLPGEAEKKLIRPDLANQPGKYGFGFNVELAGRYKGEITDDRKILIFTSKGDAKNVVGNPSKDGLKGGKGITLSGDVVNLP
jgi:hypothetical protein